MNYEAFTVTLREALDGTILRSAIFDEDVRLPNLEFWSPDTDMECFTKPVHPDTCDRSIL